VEGIKGRPPASNFHFSSNAMVHEINISLELDG
jgi:hypothetical protein